MAVARPSSERSAVTRRLTGTVFVTVAFGMVAFYAALTAAPLVAVELTGTERWSGVPGAAGLVGIATASAVLAEEMARRGRRAGLVLGWTTGAVGAAGAVAAIAVGWFPLLLLAMLAIGWGHSANLLARYAAADASPVARRASMLSLVVWAGTIGAMVGPSLLGPGASVAAWFDLPDLTGGYLAAIVATSVAATLCAVRLRPDPSQLVGGTASTERRAVGAQDTTAPARGVRLRDGRQRLLAITALVTAQFVMVLIMTVTPVHVRVRGHDHSLGDVGVVLSLHFLGMFGLAPIIGRVADRRGPLPVVLVGLSLVAVPGVVAATVPPTSVGALATALLLLGLGWSAAFVASSAMLADAGASLQGRVDSAGWAVAALASVGSGLLLQAAGYAVLSLIGAGLAVVPIVWVIRTLRGSGPVSRPA